MSESRADINKKSRLQMIVANSDLIYKLFMPLSYIFWCLFFPEFHTRFHCRHLSHNNGLNYPWRVRYHMFGCYIFAMI